MVLFCLAELILKINDTQYGHEDTGDDAHRCACHGGGAEVLHGKDIQNGGRARENSALECDRGINNARDQPSGKVKLLEDTEKNGVGDEHQRPAVDANITENCNCEHAAVNCAASAEFLIDHLRERRSGTGLVHDDSKNIAGRKQKEIVLQEIRKTLKICICDSIQQRKPAEQGQHQYADDGSRHGVEFLVTDKHQET